MKLSRRESFLCYFYYLIFLAAWGFLFWKCRFGFANVDESFYLTIPYRFCKGDLMLLHEWNLSQTSGLLLVPMMKLYLLLFHSTEAMLLHFRWIFTFFWGAAALFFFLRLKKLSLPGAMFASLVFLLYTPHGIMALSYNSMGILMMINACVLLITGDSRLDYIISGVFLAFVVLCFPFALFLYPVFTLAMLLGLLLRKRTLVRPWLFVTIGAGAVFICFCIVLLLQAPVSKYLEILPDLLYDPDHPFAPLILKVRVLLYETWKFSRYINYYLLAVIILAVVSRYVRSARLPGLMISSAVVMLVLTSADYINHIMFPLSIPGFFCGVSMKEDREMQKLFAGGWIPGLIFAVCVQISSNLGFVAFSSACAVMAFFSAVMVWRCLQQCMTEESAPAVLRSLTAVVMTGMMIAQLGYEFYYRRNFIFWDLGAWTDYSICETGPEKGIRMGKLNYEYYTRSIRDTSQVLEELKGDKLLFFTQDPWLYLFAEKECASCSAWLSGSGELMITKLDAYYRAFPEKLPDLVFVSPDLPEAIPYFESMDYQTSTLETPAFAAVLCR